MPLGLTGSTLQAKMLFGNYAAAASSIALVFCETAVHRASRWELKISK